MLPNTSSNANPETSFPETRIADPGLPFSEAQVVDPRFLITDRTEIEFVFRFERLYKTPLSSKFSNSDMMRIIEFLHFASTESLPQSAYEELIQSFAQVLKETDPETVEQSWTRYADEFDIQTRSHSSIPSQANAFYTSPLLTTERSLHPIVSPVLEKPSVPSNARQNAVR